jgi:hypothetical protein
MRSRRGESRNRNSVRERVYRGELHSPTREDFFIAEGERGFHRG